MAEVAANVYKKGKLAATFERIPAGVKFEYLPTYAQSRGGAIASTLPTSCGPLIFSNGATPAFFSGLLPEGRRLDAMARRIKTSKDSELDLLLDIGQDLIGDVQVVAPGRGLSLARPTLELNLKDDELDFNQMREQQFGSKASGIPGVQDKVSSKMLNVPARRANVEYILKFNPTDVPFAVENEYFFLGLAKKCGLEVAPHRLLKDSQGQSALLIERFDRISGHEQLFRLAVEDGCQALNRYPADKYNIDLVEMAQGLISLCPARGAAGYELFKQIAFSWLIGNGDAHAKNYSVLESQEGEYMISPTYDLLCTHYYRDRSSALAISGNSEQWTRGLLLDVASSLLVPAKAAEKALDKMLASLRSLPQQISDGALPFRRDQNFEAAGFLKRRAKKLSS